MKQNPYPIESVEIYYNGKTEAFDKFLASLLHDYLSTDNFSPDREDAAPATKKLQLLLEVAGLSPSSVVCWCYA